MAGLTPYVVLLWFPVTLALFARLPRPWALVLSCVLGTLFLPEVQSNPSFKDVVIRPFRLPLMEFSKVNVIAYAALLSCFVFDARRIREVRWNAWDVPALALSVLPAVSAGLNGATFDAAFAEFRAAIDGCLEKIPTKHRDSLESLMTQNVQTFDPASFLAV